MWHLAGSFSSDYEYEYEIRQAKPLIELQVNL